MHFPNWKSHKIEIALGVFSILVIWYLHKRHAFYGEGGMAVMPMAGAGGGMMDMSITGMPGVDALLKAQMLTMPVMDQKKFADCLNAGVDFAECSEAFGGGNKVMGGVVDTLNLENCINAGKSADTCIGESTRGMGRAAVMKMM